MDIKTYSRKYSHFYGDPLPPLLAKYIRRSQPGQRIMDVGCGDGRILHTLQAQGLLEGLGVTAVDLSPDRIQTVAQLNPNFRCVVAGACDLMGIADQSVDFVISTQVIEHVSQDKQMIREICRVLAPGGLAYVTTVFKKRWAWYWHRCNGKWVLDPTHVREYMSDSQLLGAMTGCGLAVLESKKQPLAYPLIDPFLRLAKVSRDVLLSSRLLRALRRIKLPILGYYNWEVVVQKPLPAGR